MIKRNIKIDFVPMGDNSFKIFIENMNKYDLEFKIVRDYEALSNAAIILSGSWRNLTAYLSKEYAAGPEHFRSLKWDIK